MFKAEISKKSQVILLTLLVILNFILRIPSIPHEKGRDSFLVHSLANSITYFGQAEWWLNWLSVFGLYPYSIASAVPFSLSGVEQLTGIEMEKTILLFSIIIGLLSIFIVYVLAGRVYNDFLFKFIMAFLYSTSSGIMLFTTWEISSRGPFIIFMTLFLFILLKKLQYAKKTCLLLILFVFLAATHHYFYFLFPLVVLFITLKFLPKIILGLVKPHHLNYLYAISLIAFFLFPFFTRMQMAGGSRYSWLIDIAIVNIRFVGPLIVLIPSGLIYITFKNNKKIEEWYFLGAFLLIIPFMYNIKYGVYISLLFTIFFISIAFRNLLNAAKVRKTFKYMIIFALFFFIIFSSFYNHNRTGDYGWIWYMDEKTYTSGQWIDIYISDDKYILNNCYNHYTARIIAQQSDENPIILGGILGLVYGQVQTYDIINLEKVPYTSAHFYFEGPYKMTNQDSLSSTTIGWFFDNKGIGQIKDRYNNDYLLQSSNYRQVIDFTEDKKERIYSNGLIELYDMRNI